MARRSPAASLPAKLPTQAPALIDKPVPAPDAEAADQDLAEDDWGDAEEVIVAPAPSRAPQQREMRVSAAAHGQRLDVFLVAGASEFSRNHLKHLIEEGCVEVDGKPATSASRKVLAGQKISVVLKPTAQSQAFVPEAMDLPIVFEDAHLLVVNKPAGLVVHPAAGNWTGTLMNGLLAHHAGAVNLPRAGIVHRLDKDTSGLMVVGKTLEAVTGLSRAIAAREVSRQYRALVHGGVPASFTVESSIWRDPSTRIRMAVVPSGKPARTDVKRLVVGEWAPDQAAIKADQRLPTRVYSGVLCTLHTGRTHQIRVHLSSRKYPLVADALYGGAQALGMTRQALHAVRLAFVHPITGEQLVFDSDLPPDMAQAWQALSASSAGL